jgi:hypothetical protein
MAFGDTICTQLTYAVPNGLACFGSGNDLGFVIGDYRIIQGNVVVIAVREGISRPSEDPEGESFYKVTVEDVTEVGSSLDAVVGALLTREGTITTE